MSGKPRLKLKPAPDGFGFLYGQLFAPDGAVAHVDVLPPVGEWRGNMKLADYPPHATDWIVYADGEEIARVARREDLVDTLATLRLKHSA